MKKIVSVVCCACGLLLSGSASGQLAYDNLQTDAGYYLDWKSTEAGDQITLAPGTPRVISSFTLEYWVDPAVFTGAEQVQVRFYDLNGGDVIFGEDTTPTPTPGGVLYDSGLINAMSGRVRLSQDGLAVTVPDKFVLSIQLSGGSVGQGSGGVSPTGAGGGAGVTLYNPPAVGSNEWEFWQKVGGAWELWHFEQFPTDFGAQITVVPEPGATSIVLLLTAAGVAGALRFRKPVVAQENT